MRTIIPGGGGLAVAALLMSLEAEAIVNAPPEQRRRWIAGPHETPSDEPQREDYPSRQAWRAEHRRWQEANPRPTRQTDMEI